VWLAHALSLLPLLQSSGGTASLWLQLSVSAKYAPAAAYGRRPCCAGYVNCVALQPFPSSEWLVDAIHS
jgi:hypothetical protein